MPDAGYVYVLINSTLPGLVKVGKTTKDSESRAKELSSATGVPTPFTVAFDAYFNDCTLAEDYIHNKLESNGYRLSNNKEFFQAPLKEVIKVITEAEQVLKSVQNTNMDSDNKKDNANKQPCSIKFELALYNFNNGKYIESYELLKEALILGSDEVYFHLGWMTWYGKGCLQNEEKGFEYFKKGAEKGSGDCFGELLLKGPIDTGIMWFEKLLESKNVVFSQKESYIFYYLVNIKQRYSNENKLNDVLLKYSNGLSPIKRELIKYTVKKIEDVGRTYPDLNPNSSIGAIVSNGGH